MHLSVPVSLQRLVLSRIDRRRTHEDGSRWYSTPVASPVFGSIVMARRRDVIISGGDPLTLSTG